MGAQVSLATGRGAVALGLCMLLLGGCNLRPRDQEDDEFLTLDEAREVEDEEKQDRVLALGAGDAEALGDTGLRSGSDPFAEGGRGRLGRAARLSDIRIAAIDLKGVVIGADGAYAVIDAPCDGCSHIEVGDRLKDGYVKSIEGQKVVFVQRRGDPADPDATVEVVKALDPFAGR